MRVRRPFLIADVARLPACGADAFQTTPAQATSANVSSPVGAILPCGEGGGGDSPVRACATTDGGRSTMSIVGDSVQYVDPLAP